MTGQFEVTAEKLNDGTHELRLSGELDQATAPQLEEPLANALGDGAGGGVLVNLTDCEFIDSTGIALLVNAYDRVGDNGRRFVLCCPHTQVRRLLEITGVDQGIELHDTRDEALAALS